MVPAHRRRLGVEAYSWLFSAAGDEPDNVEEGPASSCTSSPLAPGTWYFTVKARDRHGRWSYAAPPGADRHPRGRAGQSDRGLPRRLDLPLVPTSSNGSSDDSAVLSATLPGYTYGTYWNLSGRNDGESATSSGFSAGVYADADYRNETSFNLGRRRDRVLPDQPRPHHGGRRAPHDPRLVRLGEDLAETSETDNTWGHQFVWTPYHLMAGTVHSQPSIENAFAGWEHVTDGSTLWMNEWGLRFDNSGWWNACVVWAHDNAINYDIKMHLASTGATSGFTTALTTSSLAAGKLDAVIVNRNATATAEYDVGVYYSGVANDLGFKSLHVENDYADFDITTTATLGPDAWLSLYEFEVSPEKWSRHRVRLERPATPASTSSGGLTLFSSAGWRTAMPKR